MNAQLLSSLSASNWRLKPARSAPPCHERLNLLPAELRALLTAFDWVTNQDETRWLITAKIFANREMDGFNWNEFELISLAAAEDDQAWSSEVIEFWRGHVPILMSVKGHYEYVAYCCEGPNCGNYVLGFEPEFEEAETIATNFSEFKEWLAIYASKG